MSAGFRVTSPSRHPANQQAYEALSLNPAAAHRYRPDYVNPRSWKLLLRADLQVADPHRPPTGGEQPPPQLPELPPPELPQFRWRVREVNGAFSASASGDNAEVAVPRPGAYDIELEVHQPERPGELSQVERSSLRYVLRDFCIVSLGDSYASGQGNPDIPAIPSLRQTLACSATTLLILREAIAAKLRELRAKVEEVGLAAVEAELSVVPFGYLVAEAAGVLRDAERVAEAAFADAKRLAVEIVDGVVDFAVELITFGLVDSSPAPRPAQWQEPLAYRSYRSAPSLAARLVESTSARHADRCTFLSFARTGSEIVNGLLGPRRVDGVRIDGWVDHLGQIREAARSLRGRPVDALLLSIGGNDVGFAPAIKDLLIDFGIEDLAAFRDDAFRRVTALEEPFNRLRDTIDREISPRVVLITEYPVRLFGEKGGCGIFSSDTAPLDISPFDAGLFAEVGLFLNQLIKRKAQEFGWRFVTGVDLAFFGHDYCAERSFYVSAEESCRNQGDFEGMVHPNANGQRAYARAIVRELRVALSGPNHWLEAVLATIMT